MFPQTPGPIGLFDSGYGGLTIFDKIHQLMPGYDYVYLGDNARSPYGTRSFEVVYQFTRQAVLRLVANWLSWLVIRHLRKRFVRSNKKTCLHGIPIVVYWESSVLQLS